MRTSGKSLQMKNAHIWKVPADAKCAHLESPCRCKPGARAQWQTLHGGGETVHLRILLRTQHGDTDKVEMGRESVRGGWPSSGIPNKVTHGFGKEG